MTIGKVLAAVLLSAVAFTVEAQSACESIVHRIITVDGRNDEWTPAGVKVNPGDVVLVTADGKVKLGSYLGWVTSDGNGNADGRLEMKIGTAGVVPVKSKWMGAVEQAGSVKFKVRDSNYSDNDGSYKVVLIIMPAGALPPPTVVENEK